MAERTGNGERELLAYLEELRASKVAERRGDELPAEAPEPVAATPAAPAPQSGGARPDEPGVEAAHRVPPATGAPAFEPRATTGLLPSTPAPPVAIGRVRTPLSARPGEGLRLLFPCAEPAHRQESPPPLTSLPASTAVLDLDVCLGGGFFPGLWMIVGRPDTGKTALLEGVGWEAATTGRQVVYFALDQGEAAVRARFRSVLEHVLGSSDPSPSPRTSSWVHPQSEGAHIRELDSILDRTVLSHMWIVDSIESVHDPVAAFLRTLDRTLADLAGAAGHGPVVLIDDLAHLLEALGVDGGSPAVRLVTGLDALLLRWRSPGLAAFADVTALVLPQEEAKTRGLDRLGHGRIELRSRSEVRIDLDIRENPHNSWRGTLPLLLHRDVGMFTPLR